MRPRRRHLLALNVMGAALARRAVGAALALLATGALHSAMAAPFRMETGLPPPPRPAPPEPKEPPPARTAPVSDGEPAESEDAAPVPAPRQRPAMVQPFDVPSWPTGAEHPWVQLRDFQIGVRADAFVSLRLDRTQGDWVSEFELTRVQLTSWASWQDIAGVQLTLESIRSSGARSYYGIDGDSLLPRFKYAFAEVTPLGHWLSLRAGLVPDLLVPVVEASWDLRVQGPTGIERDGLFNNGDLGATVEAALPIGLGSVALQYGNGEGTRQREQNNLKNATVALRIVPGRHALPGLVIHLLYRDGSVGAGMVADSRIAGGVVYTGRRLGAGAIGSYAIGFQGDGPRDAAHVTAWARGELPYRIFLFGRGDLLWSHVQDPGNPMQLRAVGGVGYGLPRLVRVFVSVEATVPMGALQRQVPSVEEQLVQVQVEARL